MQDGVFVALFELPFVAALFDHVVYAAQFQPFFIELFSCQL